MVEEMLDDITVSLLAESLLMHAYIILPCLYFLPGVDPIVDYAVVPTTVYTVCKHLG